MNQITKAIWVKVAVLPAVAGFLGVVGCAQQRAGQNGSGGGYSALRCSSCVGCGDGGTASVAVIDRL